MSLDLTKFACWSTAYASYACTMEEGVMPSEKALNNALYGVVSNGQSIVLTLPIAPGTVIANSTKFFVSVHGMRDGSQNATLDLTLKVDGVSKGTGTLATFQSVAATKTTTITATGPVTVTATVTLTLTFYDYNIRVYYYDDDLHVGMDSTTGANFVPRTAFAASNPVTAFGTHALPTVVVGQMIDLTCDMVGVYPADLVVPAVAHDSSPFEAHLPSDWMDPPIAVAASTITTAFAGAGKRTIAHAAYGQAPFVGARNTYIEQQVHSDEYLILEVGTAAWELASPFRHIELLSLNGIDPSNPALHTADLLTFRWYNPGPEPAVLTNVTYAISVDLAGGGGGGLVLEGVWPASNGEYSILASALGLADGAVYKWKIAVVCTDPEWYIGAQHPGFFVLDRSSTGLKIISPVGTKDNPAIVTGPLLVAWALSKEQGAFNVCVHDAAGAVVYETGWVASDVQSHTIT